jgi:hypothetical protein
VGHPPVVVVAAAAQTYVASRPGAILMARWEGRLIKAAVAAAAAACGRHLTPEEARDLQRRVHDEMDSYKRFPGEKLGKKTIDEIARLIVCGH